MTTATIRLPRARRDDRGAHRIQIVMTIATIWVLHRLKPMTTVTTARQRARKTNSAMATA